MLSHNTLSNYYRNVFNMTHHHGYTISDVEDMIVYELEIYAILIKQMIDEKKLAEEN